MRSLPTLGNIDYYWTDDHEDEEYHDDYRQNYFKYFYAVWVTVISRFRLHRICGCAGFRQISIERYETYLLYCSATYPTMQAHQNVTISKYPFFKWPREFTIIFHLIILKVCNVDHCIVSILLIRNLNLCYMTIKRHYTTITWNVPHRI